jgi:hypothetical protein
LAGAAPEPAFAPAGGPIFISGFLSGFDAPGYDGLFFDLTFIPLSGAALCTGAEVVGQSCRPDLSSPLTLKVLAQGTEITFGFAGFFEDPNQGADSRTPGTVQYTAATAWTMPQILSLIGGGGSITADYSAEANASSIAAVPEPATLLALGLGLGFLARRRRI